MVKSGSYSKHSSVSFSPSSSFSRAERNRVAARTCRARKQVYIAGLEMKVAELSEALRELGYAGESQEGLERFVLKSVVGIDLQALLDSSFRSSLKHGCLNLTSEQEQYFQTACESIEAHSSVLDAAVYEFRRALAAISGVSTACRRELEHFFAVLDEKSINAIHDLIHRFSKASPLFSTVSSEDEHALSDY